MQQDFRTVHEAGLLRDILDLMSGSEIPYISDIGNRILGKKDTDNINISRNIAKSASALTATFPVIVTEATELDHAVMVSKSIERKAVEMLRMLFAANQITNVTGAQDYLNKFHNNIDTGIDYSKMDVDDVIDVMNNITESTDSVHDAAIAEAMKAVCEDTKNNIHYVLETGIKQTSIRDFRVRGSLQEADVWNGEGDVLNEYQVASSQRVSTRTEWRGGRSGNIFNTTHSQTVEDIDPNDPDKMKNAYEMLNKSVIKTDVQKANESVPSMVIVNFISKLDGGRTVTTSAVIGVKAVLHYVSSEDMVNRIILKNKDKSGLVNLIRATTREISFFKDFLFAVKRAKIDAVAKSGRGSNSKIWKILELRAHKSDLNRAAGKNNTDCAAITSIILSKAEVELIKKEHRIDLMKVGTLIGIMRGYNLMCAVIVDDVAERVDFLYDDGEKQFETLSFMSLEREDSNGQLKKVINVLAARGR